MPKKYEVSITQKAQQDVDRICGYISSDSQRNAINFIDQIEKRAFSLETFPERYPLISENIYLHLDYRHIIYKKYRIIYRISDDAVYILRIIHSSRLLDIESLEQV